MHAMRPVLFAVALAALPLGACAGGETGTRATQQPTAQSDMICRQEAPTGSNIRHNVCRPREQVEQERKSAQDFMQTPRPQASRAR